MSSVSTLTNFTIQFNRFVPIPIFIFGFIGNILNIIVFTRPSLRKRPCPTYFFSSSIANLNVLFFGLVVRVIMDGFGYDFVSSNLVFCRFRYLILHCSLSFSSWFTVLAGVDRYCISSRNANRRRFSTLKHARLLILLATCICFVIYAHVFGLFEIEQLKSGPYCYARAGTYRVFYDFLFSATYSFTPPIIMIIVGFGTLDNIRRAPGQQFISKLATGTTSTNVIQLRKRDRQLLIMLFVQLISIVVCTLPIAIQKLYSTFTQNYTKSDYQLAVENLVAQISRQLSFLNSSTSFYLYTLSASAFRRELAQMMANMIGFIFGVNSSFHRRFQQIIQHTSRRTHSMTTGQTVYSPLRNTLVEMKKTAYTY